MLAGEARHDWTIVCEIAARMGYAGAFVMPPDADIQTVGVRTDQQRLGALAFEQAAGLLGQGGQCGPGRTPCARCPLNP